MEIDNQKVAKIELHDKNNNTVGYAIIDANRFDELNKYKWYLTKYGYAHGNVNNKNIFMHRFIIKAGDGQIIDHINREKLDNRIINLRVATFSENAQNKSHNNTSSYMGVFYNKNANKYYATFSVNRIHIHLGSFTNAYDAAYMRDRYVVHKLNHASLNFPDKKDEYLHLECPNIKTRQKKYVGVRILSNGKYAVGISINKIYKRISIHDTLEVACDAYDEYIINNHIKNKQLNNPLKFSTYVNEFGKTFDREKLTYTKIDDEIGTVFVNKKCPNNNKQIHLIKITNHDFERVKYFTLNIDKRGYAHIIVNNAIMSLHRYLMNVNDPKIYVDHIDGDKLNNVRLSVDDHRNNLRLSNAQLNGQNKSKRVNTSSSFYGVTKFKSGHNSYWRVSIKNGANAFNWANISEEKCARAYDMYILKYLPDSHYKLNFKWDKTDLHEWSNIINIDRRVNWRTISPYIGVCKIDNTGWVSVIGFTNEYGEQRLYIRSDTAQKCAIKRDLLILANFQHKKQLILNFDWSSEIAIQPIMHIIRYLDARITISSRNVKHNTKYNGIFKTKDSWVAYIMQNNKIMYCGLLLVAQNLIKLDKSIYKYIYFFMLYFLIYLTFCILSIL